MTTCGCGCGGEVRPGNRYINHHQSRSVPPPKVNPETGCLEWQGYIDPSTGYGQCWDPMIQRKEHAHRKVWREQKGPIASGLTIHHKCQIRHCVNIEHLELLTRRGHGRLAPGAKITIKQVKEIRRRLREGERNVDLAREFGLQRNTIGDIKAGRSWTDAVTCPSCGHEFDPYE